VGSSTVVGDTRWTGMYGINADLIARTHCSVEVIKLEGIKVGWPDCLEFLSIYWLEDPINFWCSGGSEQAGVLSNQVPDPTRS
jgi:hypothetical protein